MSKQTQPRLSGSQRQQRYRAARRLCSIDISQRTASLLADLRVRTGLTTDRVIAAAAEMLERTLKGVHREPQGPSTGRRNGKRATVPTKMPSPGGEFPDTPAEHPSQSGSGPTASARAPRKGRRKSNQFEIDLE